MPRHPIDGMKGSKPRLPGNDGKPEGKALVAELSAQYLEARNSKLRAQAFMAEAQAKEKAGELISKRMAGLQVAFLLGNFRQKVMVAPTVMARRLVAQGLIEVKNEHQVARVLREDLCQMLSELANLPKEAMAAGDDNWIAKIDGDLLEQVDGESPAPRITPEQAKAQAAKAKIRREKKTETMRKLRAEGRTA